MHWKSHRRELSKVVCLLDTEYYLIINYHWLKFLVVCLLDMEYYLIINYHWLKWLVLKKLSYYTYALYKMGSTQLNLLSNIGFVNLLAMLVVCGVPWFLLIGFFACHGFTSICRCICKHTYPVHAYINTNINTNMHAYKYTHTSKQSNTRPMAAMQSTAIAAQ